MSSMRIWLPLVIALVLNAAANVLMKIGSNTASVLPVGTPVWQRLANFLNLATLVGILLFAANVLFYRKALDNLDISVAYPVMVSVGLILVTLAAVCIPVLSERVSTWQIFGMILIAAGVWLVARGQ